MKKLIAIAFILLMAVGAAPAKAKKPVNLRLIFIGNSITAGTRLADRFAQSPPAACSSQLAAKRGIAGVKFANCGVSGKTTLDFLPGSGKNIDSVVRAADKFTKEATGLLVFSIKLGTNDSAIQGPNGAPVSPDTYEVNLEKIVDYLAQKYPGSVVVIHHATWYSPNTYNSSRYLEQGLLRLQSYFPRITSVVNRLEKKYPQRIFTGDTHAFNAFKKNYAELLGPEKGQQGTFYLHPNEKGAAVLGQFWAEAIYKAVKSRAN